METTNIETFETSLPWEVVPGLIRRQHPLCVQIQKASCSSGGGGEGVARKGTISQYFTTLHCPVCDELTQLGVCARCRAWPQRVAVTLQQDIRQREREQDRLLEVR